MQDTEWVNAHLTELLAPGQIPLMKLEIEVGADNWVNLSALEGKNYVEGASISLGGAAVTPKPVGGKVNVALSNKDSIFYPQHPDSPYKDYLKTGRKIRASIGATYGGEDRYWQRLIGVMGEPKFSAPDYKVSVDGGDYMKFLQDAELRIPDNYWGTYQTFDSFPSDGLMGDELYNEVDAMDINNEANNVTNWPVTGACTFASVYDTGGGSQYVGELISTSSSAYTKNLDVGTVVAGKEYKVSFKYRRTSGTGKLRVSILQDDGGEVELNFIDELASFSYETAVIYFTAAVSGPVRMKLMAWEVMPGERRFRIDQISLWRFIPYWERYYPLPEACKGAFYVTLDKGEGAEPVWEGTGDEDWQYEKNAESGNDVPPHPARIVFFNINKEVPKGTNNLVIHYFTQMAPENAVARILYFAGLYESEDAALDAMEYTPTEILIDRIWFKPGSKCLNAIKKLCERCDYRFHFKWDGTPVFKSKPAPETVAFAFTDQKHISSFSNYQARNEIKNRIIIKGEKQAAPASREETMPPELKGEAYDQDSIDEYGERTLTIDNHLFQTQTPINAMCASLLAERKDPKWFTDLEIEYRPVPIEKGDKISWKERLSPILEITQEGVVRDIKLDNFNTIYVCEK
ncbi:hypothetical protein ES707_00322 [subsurface metagenome]